MLKSGILNPGILDLVARVRHTNTLVISDRAFPYWPEIETVDIALTAGIPTVLDVLNALRPNFNFGAVWQAEEFLQHNEAAMVAAYEEAFGTAKLTREPHVDFKKRVPAAIGLIRTGDATMYGNIIIESA